MAQIQESVEIFGGISYLRPDFALAVKVKCAYLRASDPVGMQKRITDFRDGFF
jgi:hypothetical protein